MSSPSSVASASPIRRERAQITRTASSRVRPPDDVCGSDLTHRVSDHGFGLSAVVTQQRRETDLDGEDTDL